MNKKHFFQIVQDPENFAKGGEPYWKMDGVVVQEAEIVSTKLQENKDGRD